jgi:hypothetical protein
MFCHDVYTGEHDYHNKRPVKKSSFSFIFGNRIQKQRKSSSKHYMDCPQQQIIEGKNGRAAKLEDHQADRDEA